MVEKKPESNIYSPLRVLLVEDDPGIRSFMAKALRLFPYVGDFDIAKDCELALDLIDKSETGYNLIIADRVMPGMGGLELARTTKNQQRSFILATARWDDLTKEQLAQLGINHLLKKPFGISDLKRLIDEVYREGQDKI